MCSYKEAEDIQQEVLTGDKTSSLRQNDHDIERQSPKVYAINMGKAGKVSSSAIVITGFYSTLNSEYKTRQNIMKETGLERHYELDLRNRPQHSTSQDSLFPNALGIPHGRSRKARQSQSTEK